MSLTSIGSFGEFHDLEDFEPSSFESSSELDFYDLLTSSSPKKDYSLLVHGSYESYNELNGDCMDIAGKKVNLHPNYRHVNSSFPKDMDKIVQECFSPTTLRLKAPTPPPSRCASPDPLSNDSYLNQITTALNNTYNKYFYDYNHEWKKVKYQLNLDIMKTEHSKIIDLWDTTPKTPLANSLINLAFQLDYNSNKNRHLHPRIVYREFLKKLRTILTSKDYLEQRTRMQAGEDYDKTIHDLSKLCACRFTSVYLYPFLKKLVSRIISAGLNELNIPKEALKNIPLSKRLHLQFHAITACPQLYKAPKVPIDSGKLGGTMNVLFDPHMGSNMPYVLYDLFIQWEIDTPVKPIRCLRIGTPTLQRTEYANCTWAGEASIIPEFEAYIQYLDSLGQTLLYISLQEDEERWVCGEKARNNALRELHLKYPNAFKLIVLSQDSLFYHQQGEHENVHDAKIFKNTFLKELCARSEGKGFDIPEEFQDVERFNTIIDRVHKDYFGDRQELTKQERCDFIEIAYTRLNLFFLKTIKPDYFIICCKDGMERAKKLVILLLHTLLSMWRKLVNTNFRKMLETYCHAAAFLIKKQAMILHRRERMLSALEVMEAHPEASIAAKSDFMVSGDICWLDLA